MKFKFQRQVEKGKRQREQKAAAKAKPQPEAMTTFVVQAVEAPKPKSAAKLRREARLAKSRSNSGSRKGSPALGPRNGVQHGVADPFACDEAVLQRAGLDELEFEADMAQMLESMLGSSAEKAA